MTNNQNVETKTQELICQKRRYDKSFDKIVNCFKEKLTAFDPVENSFEIEEYFGEGKGQVTSTNLLIKNEMIKSDWLREYKTKKGKIKKDFKGLYVFIHNNKPFYVGISKGVIGRIIQHVKGHNHNTSTLAYKIGLIRFELMNGYEYNGERKKLNFESEVEPVKAFLLKQKLSFIPIDNDEELTLFEIYCSMQLQTWLNTFETH